MLKSLFGAATRVAETSGFNSGSIRQFHKKVVPKKKHIKSIPKRNRKFKLLGSWEDTANINRLHTKLFRGLQVQPLTTMPVPEESPFPKLENIKAEDTGHAKKLKKFGNGTYFIKRSRFHELPVYIEYKSQAPITKIKNIAGDVGTLRQDLFRRFPKLNKKNTTFSPYAKNIEIKGRVKAPIERFLKEQF